MDHKNRTFPGMDIEIKDAQRVQLDILLMFDRLCEKHDIHYQLFAGTLIGAIRHHGFIPWDDDVDVCMLRSEYDRFLQVAQKELGPDYFLQTYETDPNFQSQYAKIKKNNTLYVEELVQDVEMHKGIFMDVFPYDLVKPHTLKGEVQRMLIHRLKIINYCRVMRVNETEPNSFFRLIKKGTYYVLKVIPKRPMDRLITKLSRMFDGTDAEYVADLSISTSKEMYKKFTIRRNVFEQSIPWEFEGHLFPVPREYDYVLSKNYGDYMKLPPESEQEPHHGIIKIRF